MSNDDLISRINKDLETIGFSENVPTEVNQHLKKEGIEELSEMISDTKSTGYTNIIQYIQDYLEFPLLRKFDYIEHPKVTFEAKLLRLFKEFVDFKKFQDNIRKDTIYDAREHPIQTTIGDYNNYYKLSDDGQELVSKAIKEYPSFDKFNQAIFVIKLAETIGYCNLLKISGLEDKIGKDTESDIEQQSVDFLKNSNLTDVYLSLIGNIKKKYEEKSPEDFKKVFSKFKNVELSEPSYLKELVNTMEKYVK